MQTKILLTALIFILFSPALFSQDENPFQSIGKKGEVVTLSSGKYVESFDKNDVQQIGTALINIKTMKVVKLLSEIESENRLDNSSSSRFLSVDPITNRFAMLTPYQYASNSPIAGADLDGLEFYFAADGSFIGQSVKGGTQIRVATNYNTYSQTSNGKSTTQFAIKEYKDIDKVAPSIASKVYESIFRKEVPGGDLKSITVINNSDKPSLGAETYGKGEFGINTANEENGEKLNNDYYNAAATFYHENEHSIKLPIRTVDGFSHFDIEKKVVERSGLYEKTSANFKQYAKQLFSQYLGFQESSIRDLVSGASAGSL